MFLFNNIKYLVLIMFLSLGVFSCSSDDTKEDEKTTTQKKPPSKTDGDQNSNNNTPSTFSATDNLISISQTGYVRNGIAFGSDTVAFDANGDGEKELLVGASLSNIDGSDSGIVYVYSQEGTYFSNKYSSLVHPPITSGNINFGASLALGDIDADGHKDLLVGAPGDDSCGGSNRGAVYVFYYKSSGIDTSPNLKICYPEANNNANFGYDIAVEDVDQDGKDDILISADRNDTGGTDRGRAYLFINDGDWTSDITFSAPSPANSDRFGSFVAFVHSDADNYLDIAIGAYYKSYSGATHNGVAYIYNNDGTGTFLNPNVPDLAVKPSFLANYIYFGYSGLGIDINGDDRQDLVVSIPGVDMGFGNRGTVVVYTSLKDDTGGSNQEKSPDITINYPEGTNSNYQNFGYWMGKGDFDDDTKDDLMLAVVDSAASLDNTNMYFYSTSSNATLTTPIFDLKNNNVDINPYTRFGMSVNIGDLDGDGIRDLVVGVPEEDEIYSGWSNVGLALVYLGVDKSSFKNTPSYIIRPPYPLSNEQFAYAVHIMDINGDGNKDLLIGAPADDLAGTDSGSIYVYFGGQNIFDINSDLIITNPGDGASSWFGSSITSGDLNGDNYPELIVGAEQDDAAGTNRGAIYIWRTDGDSVDVDDAPSQTITCNFAECSNSCYFGSSLAVVDVDPVNGGTNYKDLLIGAERLDSSGTDAGGVFVFKGTVGSQGDNPVDTSSHIMINDPSDNNSNYVGSAMAVGDFDGDHIDDLVIGADHEDSFLVDSGAAYIWYIKESSFDMATALPNLRYYGNTNAYQNLGSSLGGVDANNDGKLDLIVGASGYDSPKQDAGILYIDMDFLNR